jgi:hypothetical protein
MIEKTFVKNRLHQKVNIQCKLKWAAIFLNILNLF